jgi:hypothetical protein
VSNSRTGSDAQEPIFHSERRMLLKGLYSGCQTHVVNVSSPYQNWFEKRVSLSNTNSRNTTMNAAHEAFTIIA